MSKNTKMTETGKDILEGMNELLAHVSGKDVACRTHYVKEKEIDVKSIRKKTGLTQAAFAEAYGFPLANLKNWELGRRAPTRTAKAYLMVISEQPNVVRDALTVAMAS